jgi:hypothetical protein
VNQVIAYSTGIPRTGGLQEEDICSAHRARDGLIALFWLLLVATRTPVWAAETAPNVTLNTDTTLATEGYFVLSWNSPSPTTTYSLRQSDATSSNRTRAENLPANGAITITGLADGQYSYQLFSAGQPRGNPIEVTVQHHALSRALGFFSLGLALFCLLVISIAVGHRLTRQPNAG